MLEAHHSDHTDIMAREPKLIVPMLRCFYAWAIPLSWPLTRIAAGFILAVHGWGKIERGMSAQTAQLAKTMPSLSALGEPFSMFLTFIELGGGLCLMLGLLTRFFAAANAIEMAVLTFIIYWGNGFAWLNKGYEFTLMWGLLLTAIAFRGGGPYSLDRWLGKEL
jgi:putative oxidoreductase